MQEGHLTGRCDLDLVTISVTREHIRRDELKTVLDVMELVSLFSRWK